MTDTSNPVTVRCVHCDFTYLPARDTAFKPWCPAHPLGVMIAAPSSSLGASSRRPARAMEHEVHD